MKDQLEKAQVKAERAKSTWEKLRKERDFHKFHHDRVQKEKLQITENIKLMDLQYQYEDKIKELKKKYEMTLKEKTLEKLEKEKLQKKVEEIQDKIKDHQEQVTKAIEEKHILGKGKKA